MDAQCKKYLQRVGQRLRELRIERGWTLEEAEEHGRPSWRHLQKLESGKNFTIETLWKLSKFYKVSTDQILEK